MSPTWYVHAVLHKHFPRCSGLCLLLYFRSSEAPLTKGKDASIPRSASLAWYHSNAHRIPVENVWLHSVCRESSMFDYRTNCHLCLELSLDKGRALFVAIFVKDERRQLLLPLFSLFFFLVRNLLSVSRAKQSVCRRLVQNRESAYTFFFVNITLIRGTAPILSRVTKSVHTYISYVLLVVPCHTTIERIGLFVWTHETLLCPPI